MTADRTAIELNTVLSVAPAAQVPPILVPVFTAEDDQEAFRACEFSCLKRERVVGPRLITKVTQADNRVALPVGALYNGPRTPFSSPAFGDFGKIAGIKNLAVLRYANFLELSGSVPGADSDSPANGRAFGWDLVHVGPDGVGRTV